MCLQPVAHTWSELAYRFLGPSTEFCFGGARWNPGIYLFQTDSVSQSIWLP